MESAALVDASPLSGASRAELKRLAVLGASAPGAWTDAHAKLELSIKGVEMDTTLRALEGNALLPDEVTRDVLVAKEVHDIKRELNDRELKLKKQRGARVMRPGAAVTFAGRNVYVDHNDLDDGLRRRLVAVNARTVSAEDPANQINAASVYLVPNVASPKWEVLFSAVLSGGVVASLKEAWSDDGPLDAFTPSVESRRAVWLSSGFVDAHGPIVALYQDAVTRRGAKWNTITSLAEFVDRVAFDARRPARQRRPMETIGLVSDCEKAAGFHDVRNVFNLKGFLEFVANRDEERCRAGACGL